MVARVTDVISAAGVTADRPAVGDVPKGSLYSSTDDNVIYRNNGTTWDTWATLATGGAITDADVEPVAPEDQTGTSYTFVLADSSRLVRVSNASAITVTIPTNASVAYELGAMLSWAQQGAGAIQVVGDSGVTARIPNGDTTNAQYSMAYAVKVGTNEWYVSGDVS